VGGRSRGGLLDGGRSGCSTVAAKKATDNMVEKESGNGKEKGGRKVWRERDYITLGSRNVTAGGRGELQGSIERGRKS